MTKLYISYYEDSIHIIEGSYKKNKFNIKNIKFMKSDDIESNYDNKYNLLEKALESNTFKSKKAILCLNTRDVIVRSNKIPKIGPKELDRIMSMEIDEMTFLDRDQYTFSYEVVSECIENGEKLLDLVLAGIDTFEVNKIVNIFNKFNLKLEYIDILPTAYSRILKEIEYTDIMIVNTGNHNTAIDIYKEDSLYIHDNVPIRLNENSQLYDYMGLVDEANGLMNYYSSRNYGKIVNTILLIGNHYNNSNIIEGFEKVFTSELVCGVENLYDIENDINGNVDVSSLNQIVEILGCMIREKKNNTYSNMNLLPEYIKMKNEKNRKILKLIKIAPLFLFILSIPVIALNYMDNNKQKELDLAKSNLEQIKAQYGQINEIEEQIRLKEEEIKIYDMLLEKEPKWGAILTAIDKNIPYRVQLDNLSLSYKPNGNDENQTNEQQQNEDTTQENQQNYNLYDKVPNFISMSGKANTPSIVGQFVYNLKALTYFDNIKLSSITKSSLEDEKNKTLYSFTITANVKDGVMENE